MQDSDGELWDCPLAQPLRCRPDAAQTELGVDVEWEAWEA